MVQMLKWFQSTKPVLDPRFLANKNVLTFIGVELRRRSEGALSPAGLLAVLAKVPQGFLGLLSLLVLLLLLLANQPYPG